MAKASVTKATMLIDGVRGDARNAHAARPRAADAPAAEFSAARACAVLERLVGDGTPHPIGSAAQARVRERIIGELRDLGYAPEVQQAFACSADGVVCGTVTNLRARLLGVLKNLDKLF